MTTATEDGDASWTVDPIGVTEVTIAGVLAPGASVIVALDDRGFRIPLPASIVLPPQRTAEVPTDRRSMIDFVVAADAVTMVQAWERALHQGVSVATVHSPQAPRRPLILTFLDARPWHGVWLGVLAEADGSSDDTTGDQLLARPVRTRPRNAALTKNERAIIIGADDRASRMLGWSAEQLVGARSTRFIHPEDQERAVSSWLEMLSTGQPQRVRLRHLCADGSWLWVEAENEPLEQGEAATTVVTQLSDISDEMAAHEALAGRERLFRRLSEALPIGLLRIDPDGTISYANGAADRIFGRSGVARTAAELFSVVTLSDQPALSAALAATLDAEIDQELEVSIGESDGPRRRCTVSFIGLSDREGSPGALACVQDVTDRARLRDELHVRATIDALTGCQNRASIVEVLDRSLQTAPPAATWVMFLDLDEFKPINDSLGHAAGDEVLVHVAGQLRSVVRDRDVVGRLGGDEFLVVLRDIERAEDALAITDRARFVLNRRVELSCGPVTIGASIGLAGGQDGDTGASLITRADEEMYAEKLSRKGAVRSRRAVDRP